MYEGESNENLKYFLPHNLLNTKGTPFIFLCSLHCVLSATLQTISITVLQLTRQLSCVSNLYRTFKVYI